MRTGKRMQLPVKLNLSILRGKIILTRKRGSQITKQTLAFGKLPFVT